MPKYFIQRNIPGVGAQTVEQRAYAAGKSNEALAQIGAGIQWQYTHITTDVGFCCYIADNEELLWEHSRLSGFPITTIYDVKFLMDPTTAVLGLNPGI